MSVRTKVGDIVACLYHGGVGRVTDTDNDMSIITWIEFPPALAAHGPPASFHIRIGDRMGQSDLVLLSLDDGIMALLAM